MKLSALSDIGLVRTSNQDYFETLSFSSDTVVSVVCDGMGGANAGNIASEMAVNTVISHIKNNYRENMTSAEIKNMLKDSVLKANILVYEASKKEVDFSGMGTTLVMTFVEKDKAYIVNIGDSRAYLIDKNEIKRITTDHSVVQELLSCGEITPEDAKVHPQKNVITRAIGVESSIEIDLFDFELSENQIIFMCTDGFTNYASDSAILDLVSNSDFDDIVQQAINFAKIKGGADNITVSIIAR